MRCTSRFLGFAVACVLVSLLVVPGQAGLLGWWPFEGNLNDQSGGGMNGTYYQGNTAGGTPSYVAGPYGGQALSMDGVDDNMRANFAPPITPNKFTISWFVNPNTARAWNEQITVDNNWSKFVFHTTPGWEVYAGVVNSGNWNSRFTPTELPAGTLTASTWQHLAFSFDKGNAAFYKNGNLVASKTGMDQPAQWNQMFVGNPGADTIEGAVDDVAVWNNLLSPLDIKRLATGAISPAAASATGDVTYRIQVGAPTNNASVIGRVSDDVSQLGSQFVSASSGGSNVVTATGTLAWRLGVTDYLQLEVTSSGGSDWQSAPYVAATFTAPRGYVWQESGNQYLTTQPGPVGVPPSTPVWFASSQRWGVVGYNHGDWDPDLGYLSAAAQIQPPGPLPPLGSGFAPGTKAIWGRDISYTHLQPSFLDTAGTLMAGAWQAVGTPSPTQPPGSTNGVSTLAVRTNLTLSSVDQVANALWLRPGDAGHNASEARTLGMTQVDGASSGYTPPLVLAGNSNNASGMPENYALRMSGYVHIPAPGDYSFAVGSNDGARVTIGDTLVYENTGTVSGAISNVSTPLNFTTAGYWPFQVDWFQDGADSNLGVVVSAKAGNFATWDNTFRRLGDTSNGGLAIYTRQDGLTPLTPTTYQGLLGSYFNTANMTTPVGLRLDLQPNANILGGASTYVNNRFEFPGSDIFADGPWGHLHDNFTVQWTGSINIPTTQKYSFWMATDDVSWIYIDTNNDGTLESAPGNGQWNVYWNDVTLSAGLHKVMFQAREFGEGDWSNLQWSPGGGTAWQFVPASQFSTTLGGVPSVGPVSSGPVFEGTLSQPGDGLRVQQAPISGVASADAVRSFFANKIVHNDPAKNLFESPSPGVVRRFMDMVDPDNAFGGNFGVNEAFPNNAAGDQNNFGTRINGLFYAQSPGTYSFTVSSDEGYWLRVGNQVIGNYSGTRSTTGGTANQCYVYLPKAGLYPLEFYSFDASGQAGLEIAHGAEPSLFVTTRNPNGQNGGAATVDWGGAGFSVYPVAKLKGRHVWADAQAYGVVPALAGVPLSDGKLGVVAPEHWRLEQVLGTITTIRTPDPSNPGQYITAFRGRWFQPAGTFPAGTPLFDSNVTGYYYNAINRRNYVYPGTTWSSDQGDFIVSYTGQMYISRAGNYIFGEHVDDNAWIFIDGVQRLYNTAWDMPTTVTVPLTAGWHDVEFRTQEGGGGDYAYFFWDRGTGSLPALPQYEWSTAQDALIDPYLVKADFVQEELLLLAEGTGAIGDLVGYEGMLQFPMDWDAYYTLRLTVDIAGLSAVYQDTFRFIPEPTTLVLLAGGLLAVARRRRSRRA